MSKKYHTSLRLLLASLLLISASSFAAQLKPDAQKLDLLKVGNEVYSNVTVTAVTATDIYFTYSGGMGNAKLEHLDPALQKKFHFDPEKAAQQEGAENKVNAAYHSWISRQTHPAPISAQLDPFVSVQAADPVIQYKTYDPILQRPHHLTDGGLARIDCSFNIKTDLAIHPVSGSGSNNPSRIQIDTAKISIEFPMTITMPATPTERLKIHLEGHKQIYEHFFELGPKAAERAGRYAGRHTAPPANIADRDAREARFQEMAQRTAQMEYWKYTRYPAEAASRYYDELTEYGRNRADSDQAAREAIQHCEVRIPDGAD